MATKTNSLREKGYNIVAVTDGSKDAKGNPFLYKATSKKGTEYLIKESKGKLRAFRNKDSKDTVTLSGLFAFTASGAGDSLDLTGEGFKTTRPRGPKSAAPAQTDASAPAA